MNADMKRTLWAAADKLRSSMDAAEYKHIVLGLPRTLLAAIKHKSESLDA